MTIESDKFISLKLAAEISGYNPDYIGWLIRSGKIKGRRVRSRSFWKTTIGEVMAYKNRKDLLFKTRSEIFKERDPNKYVTLKEASKISGYTSDYIGWLIRKGKISGKKFYVKANWETTLNEIKKYKEKSFLNKSKFSSSLYKISIKLVRENIMRLLKLIAKNKNIFISRSFDLVSFVLLFLILVSPSVKFFQDHLGGSIVRKRVKPVALYPIISVNNSQNFGDVNKLSNEIVLSDNGLIPFSDTRSATRSRMVVSLLSKEFNGESLKRIKWKDRNMDEDNGFQVSQNQISQQFQRQCQRENKNNIETSSSFRETAFARNDFWNRAIGLFNFQVKNQNNRRKTFQLSRTEIPFVIEKEESNILLILENKIKNLNFNLRCLRNRYIELTQELNKVWSGARNFLNMLADKSVLIVKADQDSVSSAHLIAFDTPIKKNVLTDSLQGKSKTNEKQGFKDKAIKTISSREDFQPNEDPKFEFQYLGENKKSLESVKNDFGTVNYWKGIKIIARIKDPKGKVFKVSPNLSLKNNGIFFLNLPRRLFQNGGSPGLYKLILTIKDSNSGETKEFEKTFTWGVLAINTNKSIYLPGERVYLQMGVLDKRGHTICNADLVLDIIAPDGKRTILTTNSERQKKKEEQCLGRLPQMLSQPLQKENHSGSMKKLLWDIFNVQTARAITMIATGTIYKSPKCAPRSVTYTPDYYAYYNVSTSGVYRLKLTATTKDGTYSVTDSFEVRKLAPFDVERIGPTRIYPPAAYRMMIEIKANQNFRGQIIETVPKGFKISDCNGCLKSKQGNTKEIIWRVSWKKGEKHKLEYMFNAPNISPYFYLLGPLRFVETELLPLSNQQDRGVLEKVKNRAIDIKKNIRKGFRHLFSD